jgi:hypothetical protein
MLLDGIAQAQQVDLWSIGLHFTTCMRECGTVTLRNAVTASRFAAQFHGRVQQWEHARQAAAAATAARAASLGITDPRRVLRPASSLATAPRPGQLAGHCD